jgi:hypothetical protein
MSYIMLRAFQEITPNSNNNTAIIIKSHLAEIKENKIHTHCEKYIKLRKFYLLILFWFKKLG